MKTINDIYKNILLMIYKHGDEITPRKMKCKELINQTIVLNPKDNIITLKGFETNMNYANEELKWYLSGSKRFDFSLLINKIWKKYSDDDITVNSAYGYYFFTQKTLLNYTQWNWVIDELKNDKDSRRCIININNITHKKHISKDIPCTINCQVMIRNNKLIWITNMRSNDIYFGFRNDIYCFTELQKKMAQELRIETGLYYHNVASLHLYESEYRKTKWLK